MSRLCSVLTCCLLVTGCGGAVSGPTAPGAAAALESYLGSWSSGSAGAVPGTDRCSSFDLKVDRAPDGQSTAMQINASCAGVDVNGTGRGELSGGTMRWSASGTAARGGASCAFSFTDSTATREPNGLRVDYNATVCGLPFRGSQLLQPRP